MDQKAIQGTLIRLANEMGGGRGFRWAEAAIQIADAFNAEDGAVTLYMIYPERSYIVQPGDTLATLAIQYYGNFRLYSRIIAGTNAKAGQDPSFRRITDPRRISVGQKLWMPPPP